MSKCPECGLIGDHHTTGSGYCLLNAQLKRSEARRERVDNALREFRYQLHHDPHISEDTRITVIGHLDTALLENEDEDV